MGVVHQEPAPSVKYCVEDYTLDLGFRAHGKAAGYDIQAAETIVIEPGAVELISTGIFVSIPKGMEGQIRPRSSMGLKGIIIPNSPGTIDCDYRGEVMVPLMNLRTEPYTVLKWDRIAQIIFAKTQEISLVQVDNRDLLGYTSRQEGGFGSTGR